MCTCVSTLPALFIAHLFDSILKLKCFAPMVFIYKEHPCLSGASFGTRGQRSAKRVLYMLSMKSVVAIVVHMPHIVYVHFTYSATAVPWHIRTTEL